MLHAVIMAGGSGTRFWPASRQATPKQLLNLAGRQTMIQATVERLAGLTPPDRVLIITNQQQAAAIADQVPDVPREAILGEPCKRDTAPCVGLAAIWLLARDPQATMVVMPADHVIAEPERFRAAIGHAVALVDEDPSRIVTFGIRPAYPAETFGYIECSQPLATGTTRGANDLLARTYRVRQFHEKPSRDVASRYLEAGNFFWNSGIFVWRAQTIWQALCDFEPEMAGHLQCIGRALGQPDATAVLASEFAQIRGKSIDYAVMERYANVVVVEAPFSWDDVGSWQSLTRLHGTDDQGNTIIGRHLGFRTRGTIVRSSDDHLVVTLGLEDCVIVHTPDATLVASKKDEEAVREIVKLLEQRGWSEYL